ncbi:MAG TPA: DUF4232 domain-containing protein [Streptosporangiaceae bacterium]|nr:DUF4232 domain-containing protein [Streptosporangiaceae bacterium]
MGSWRTVIILAAVTAGALAGCGVSRAPVAGPPAPRPAGSPRTARPAPSAAASPAATPAASVATSSAVLYLETSEQVPFAGDAVALTTQASAGPGTPRWLRLASVTVSFGDGTSGSAAQPCSGPRPAPAARGLAVGHRYGRAGVFTARVTSARVCAQAGQPSLTWVNATLRVLPAAPAASASWPACAAGAVRVAASGTGAGLGHVGVLFIVRNTSAAGCRLSGYAGLRLLGRAGPLPTTVRRAGHGTYLFPPVAPHRVALPPGGYAAFELEYEDNPSGAQASEPYAQACPAASQAEVTLPGASGGHVVTAAMAPCGGDVWISPVIPGRSWVGFP